MEYTKGECGCYIRLVFDGPEQTEIVYCPLHKAAPELYELGRAIAEMKVLPVSYIELAKNIIAKVGGK